MRPSTPVARTCKTIQFHAGTAAATVVLLTCMTNAFAQEADNPLGTVVISASRTEQRILDTAASITVVTAAQIHNAQAEENISEPLARVPGIFALNRQNYAQDLLISSRGFGANSSFGARGIKIIVDGILGTMADGQGQISHIDLASADHIEIMRGPFSALYGNSAGGVINVFSENGKPGTEVTPYFSFGSFGQRKTGIKLDGEQGNYNYLVDTGHLHTDGYRGHSSADRDNTNAKLTVSLTQDTSLKFVVNSVNLSALDPLGLTAAQLKADPRQAGTGALSFDTRKSVEQTQGGLLLTQRIDANDTLMLATYDGQRHTIQYLASAVNGVIDLRRDFYGLNTYWTHAGQINGTEFKLVAGIEGNENRDHRATFSNAGGTKVVAATDQNFAMEARDRAAYLQLEWRPTKNLALTAGLRQTQTALSIVSENRLPSLGSHTYDATTDMLSAQYYVRDDTNFYVSYGQGFDTPTLNQVIYSPSYVNAGSSNLGNMGINAARTHQTEIGLKSKLSESAQMNIALFDAQTSNDIVVASSNGGKTAYMNAPKTSRQGLELSAQWQLPEQWQASVAYTVVQALVKQTYAEQVTSTNPSRTTTYLVNSGNRIPGVPDRGLFAELMWRQPGAGFEFAVEGKAAGSIAANDLNKAVAAGYGIVNLRVMARQQALGWGFSEFARFDNIFNRAYVDSVIVNQASSQFYESQPGKNWLVGAKAVYQF